MRVLRTRTFTPGLVNDLQTNGAIRASTSEQEAVDVELDGENSVAVLTAAAEDLLRDVSPLTRASAHPSPTHSVDDILEAAMRDFPDIPDGMESPPASISVLSRPRLTASQKGKGRRVATPSQEGGPASSAKTGPSATSQGKTAHISTPASFDQIAVGSVQPRVVPVPRAKAGPSATFRGFVQPSVSPSHDQTPSTYSTPAMPRYMLARPPSLATQSAGRPGPSTRPNEWNRIHSGSECRQESKTH